MIYLNTHLFLCPPVIPQLSSKKKQLFFIHFAFSLSISKKCCIVDDCICLLCRQYNAMSEKKEKKYNAYGLTCTLTNERMISVIVVTVEKIGMNTNLEFNYFVIIILILFCISKSFFVSFAYNIFNYRAVCCKLIR